MVGKGIVIRIMVFPVLCLFMLLDGRAYAELPPPPPEVKITITDGEGDPLDHWLDFSEHIVNAPAVSNTVTVANEGTAQVQMSISNSPAPPFSISNGCPGLLSSLQSCDITVAFAPLSNAGDFSDELGISIVKDAVTFEETVSLTARVLTAENQRPLAFELISPANGSVVVGNMVTFEWNPSIDPGGGTVTYDLFICDNQDFIGCAAPAISNTSSTNGTVDLGAISFAGTAAAMVVFSVVIVGGISRRRLTALLLPVLLMAGLLLQSCGGGGGEPPLNPPPGTKYFWKVVAADDVGNRTDSETWSLVVR